MVFATTETNCHTRLHPKVYSFHLDFLKPHLNLGTISTTLLSLFIISLFFLLLFLIGRLRFFTKWKKFQFVKRRRWIPMSKQEKFAGGVWILNQNHINFSGGYEKRKTFFSSFKIIIKQYNLKSAKAYSSTFLRFFYFLFL